MAEDPGDLCDIEAQIEDQVAGERMTEVVEAKRRPLAVVQPRDRGGAVQRPAPGVAVPERVP